MTSLWCLVLLDNRETADIVLIFIAKYPRGRPTTEVVWQKFATCVGYGDVSLHLSLSLQTCKNYVHVYADHASTLLLSLFLDEAWY